MLLVGILWAIFGVSAIVTPKQVKIFYSRLSQGLNPQKVSWIPLLVGIIIYMNSSISSLPLLIKIIAILAILKGLFLIFTPKNKTQSLLNRWLQLSDRFYRFLGGLILALGILVIISLF